MRGTLNRRRGYSVPSRSREQRDNWRLNDNYKGSGRERETDADGRDRSENSHRARQEHRDRDDNRKFNEERDRNSRRTRHMGFKYIEELLENDDLEDVVFKLSNDRNGFKELLQTKDTSNDMITLIVKLLSKICFCSFTHSKIHLLQAALTSNFIHNLTKFISTLALQDEREKKHNSYFWNDPDGFWNNVICVSRTINEIIPTTSCESVLKILKAAKLYIPVIAAQQSIHIADSIKTSIESLHSTVEKTSKEIENSHTTGDIIPLSVELEPPDDFREISIYPHVVEITTAESPYLRPNVVKGPYKSINHYLDVQFRLLREDFVAPLRKGICKYMKNPREKLDDIKIYKSVRFLNVEMVNEQNCFRIQFDFSKKKKSFQYENSKRFMFGSLLCFTGDNFQSLIFGKIVQRDVKDLEMGHLIVGFNADINLPRDLLEQSYLMVESTVFFEPYYQVLNVLKQMRPEGFLLERYIVRVETETHPPDYLLNIDPVFYEIECHKFWPLNWGDKKFYGLNDAQHDAFKAALTREFSIIQGPPGTGKTFLGLKMAHTLLKNKSAWYNRTPMLVICYTNHALDQFLEGLLDVTDDIVRIGNQSKNENLNQFNIRLKRHFSDPTVRSLRHQVKSHVQEIATINENLKQIELNESVIDFSLFNDVVPNYKSSWFANAKRADILRWLFGGRQLDQGQTHHWFQATNNVNTNSVNPAYMSNASNDIDDILDESLYRNNREIVDDIYDDIVVSSFTSLISLNELGDRIRWIANELNSLQANKEMWFWEHIIHEEELKAELNNAERDFQYLKRRLSEGARNTAIEGPRLPDMRNAHAMPPVIRWQLYWFWLNQYKTKLLERKHNLRKNFSKVYRRYNEMRDMEDAQVMKNSLVVGITTTGAARLQASLQTLKSPIAIVEEAAEVLEAHIISSLTSHCQHLILIGDHQQLKPSTATFKIETKYLLGVSLFERMVLNNIQCHKLTIQHRMRPEISCLIHPTIYPILKDHESVLNRPPIHGIDNCVYFIDHQEPEQLCQDESKKNVHEAKFLINLARHLVLNGYKPENITILAAYLGQMFEMRREKKEHGILLAGMRIAVLDNYQGEESDIVLLSLVRNNTENKIGFLKIENRVCVALSRARNGMYVMGNMTLLCNNSDIWPKIKESLENQDAIGPYLTLRCQIHRHKIKQVRNADDFIDIPEGGCDLMCGAQIGCGHVCKRLCHVQDRDHTSYECKEKCNRVLCNNAEHICQKLCFEECGPCTYKVERNLDCGHLVTIDCYIDPANYNCTVPVKATLPCGHEADKPCYRNPEDSVCPHPCDVRVQPCGHACVRFCHIKMDPDHLEYRCNKPCAKYKKGCKIEEGEVDDEAHLCKKLCYEECEECDVGVKKHRTVCPHVYTIACKIDVDTIECKKPCTKTLPCTHECKNRCNQPCGNCNVKVEKIVPDCNHKVKIACSLEPDSKFCQGKCPRLLACGHKCTRKCSEKCTTFCNVLVDCTIFSPCGHTLKMIKCGAKDTDFKDDRKILLKYCTEKCNAKLKCGHTCSGSCGECLQGRIHQRCKEKCGVPLICNHECPIPCRQACKPCQKACNNRCVHNRCTKKCGDPCIPCKEACTRKCEHQKCKRKCSDICDVAPCSKHCKRQLQCGHPCVGFCGDPCPLLCRVCNYKELTDIFLGNESEDDAIYVMLVDCKHTFESGDMEQWLNLDSNEVKAKVCPRCKTPIVMTQRYSDCIKRSMYDITNIKKQSFGTVKEIDNERTELLKEIQLNYLHNKLLAEKLFKASEDLPTAILKLTKMLEVSVIKNRQRRRQNLSKMDINIIRCKVKIIDFIIDVCNKQDVDIQSTSKSVTQISFILSALMNENDITDQQITDITLEVQRLSRIIQFEKIQKAPNYQFAITKNEVKVKIQQISELLDSPTRYCDETSTTLQTELSELDKLVESSVGITEIEKREIVNALGMQKGHWFKCPKGHYYVIGDCGGANQISKCNECGLKIGGQSHQLLPGQSHAPEMDDSRHPAWSEAANLQNYGFRFLH